MDTFDQLITKQLETMDKLLFLQSEIERCQDIERELIDLKDKAELKSIQEEIDKMKIDLRKIQRMFELQTEEVIRTYQDKKQPIA